MSTFALGFLNKYIETNSDVTVEEVLNDDDFLDELKLKDNNLLKFLIKHFDKVLSFILEEPNVNSDFKRIYKFPFLASEILSLESEVVQDYIFNNNSDNSENGKYPIIITLINDFKKYASEEDENVSTIPGYLEKIILSSIKQNSQKMMNLFKDHFPFMMESLMNNVHLDSIKEILFQILNLNNSTSEDIFNLEIKVKIIEEIFKCIKLNSTSNNNSNCGIIQFTNGEKIKNSVLILIKFIKHMFRLQKNEVEVLMEQICSQENFEIFENLIFQKLDSKMSDEDSNLNEWDITIKIRNTLLFYFNLIQTALLPSTKIDVKDVLTSNLFNEDILSLGENNNTNNNSGSNNENENLTEKFNLNTHTNDVVPNLFNLISDWRKNNLAEYFIKNFQNMFEIANKVKIYSKTNKQFPSMNSTSIVPVSQEYLIFLDIFISLLNLRNQNFENILNNCLYIFHILIDDAVFYLQNIFLLNKILKIYEIILFDEFYTKLKLLLFQNENKLFKKIVLNVDFKNFINLENKTLSHKNYFSLNYSHLMRLLNYFYVSMKTLIDKNLNNMSNIGGVQNGNNKINEDNSNFNLSFHFNISNEEISLFENYLSVYLDLTSKDLLSDMIQSKNELKNAGDEEIKFSEKNFYDSEAFLFTTKKIIEDSKKIKQKLKEIDS